MGMGAVGPSAVAIGSSTLNVVFDNQNTSPLFFRRDARLCEQHSLRRRSPVR